MQDTRWIAMHNRHESRGEFDYTCQSCVESLKRPKQGSAASDPGALQAVVKTWLSSTREGREFHQSPYNWSVLYESVRGDLPITVEKLRAAYHKLSRIYDLTVDANPELRRVVPPPVPVETDEQRRASEQKSLEDAAAADEAQRKALFAEWEKPVGNENPLQRVQRVTALKEAYWRSRFPRALPSTEVHPDTRRNTQADPVFHQVAVIRFDLSILFVLNRRSRREDDMDVQTDERLLRDIEGYLMELVCRVERIEEVSLVADVLVSVQDALRDLGQKPRYSLRTN